MKKPKIIQFSHDGVQLNISKRCDNNDEAFRFDDGSNSSGIRYWNNEKKHKRKFIKNKGWYLENLDGENFNPIPKEADLYFWGEWEAQSHFQLTGNKFSNKLLPHAIHSPFFSESGIGKHNTDPFVFGDNFYYTNCKQKQTGHNRILLSLADKSIILFGSEIGRKHFILDTLFVVGSSETVGDYRKHPKNYPELLRKMVIDFVGYPLDDWYRLYKGKMYNFNSPFNEESNPYTFCFFPCKVGEEGAKGFERPIIDIDRFKLKKAGAGTVLMKVNYKSETDFWQDIVAELIGQGYSLGIKTIMPSVEKIILPKFEKQ